MNAIELKNVNKKFKGFALEDVSFHLKQGYIMGLVGSNGAGKTTIIKLLMGLYIKDDGDISVLGTNPLKNPIIKESIGFVYDNSDYYDFKIKKIIKIISPFYINWDNDVFNKYLKSFKLNNKMRFKTMSRGMKLKFALAIALSHHAKLLILDEPTSGLDPVFRNEFLSILQNIMAEGNLSILFSSHITGDIERIADYITYVKNGKIVFSKDRHHVFNMYQLIKGADEIPDALNDYLIGYEKTPYNYTALIKPHSQAEEFCQEVSPPSLEDIMYFHERSGYDDGFN